MSLILEFTNNWTEPIDVQLLQKGRPEDLTGKTVTMLAIDKNGQSLMAGVVSTVDAALGIVRFTPANNDLLATKSPYRVWWIITTAGKNASSPNGEPDVWRVYPFA